MLLEIGLYSVYFVISEILKLLNFSYAGKSSKISLSGPEAGK
jgi:hypothetical protein